MVTVEEQKLELEREKLAFEKSWRKILGAALLAALVALAVGGIGFWQNRMAESRQAAQADIAQKQQDGLWGVQVLGLYVTHPEQFDPAKSPDTAAQNMTALYAAAPDLMRPILEKRKDALIRGGVGLPGAAAGITAIQEALAGVGQGIESLGDATTAHEAGLPLGVNPAAYSIYIQYGNAARDFASKFGDALAKIGFRVPDLQSVSQAPDVPEVRYYRQDQESLAEWLANRLVNQAPIRPPAVSKLVVGNGDLPGGIIEVWIPHDWG